MLLSDRAPEDQLTILSAALRSQRPVLDVQEAYYSGAIPFPFVEARYAEIYRRIQREARPKWGKLIVQAAAQRLAVEGFLTQGQPEPDEELWNSYIASNLDQTQHEVHTEAILHGRAYVLGWPQADGSIRCIPESPREVIHWRSPDRSQMLALKMWTEGDVMRARLFTRDAVFAWAADLRSMPKMETTEWSADRVARGDRPREINTDTELTAIAWRQDGPAMPNPFAPYLPVVPFVAGSRLGDVLGRSDLESALDIIDRIMALQMDLILVSKVMGFPVRWATGIEVPQDADGKPKDGAFQTSIERFLTTDNPDAKFGQLPAADLRQINSVVSSTVTELAATTETPSSVLATANLSNPVSAEALRAQEIPLVHRVRRHQRAFGPAWVHVARLLSTSLEGSIEVMWADAEVHSEAALTDALVKQVVSLGLPREAAWEALPGSTPDTVARWRTMRAAQNMEDRITAMMNEAALGTTAMPETEVETNPIEGEAPSQTPELTGG